MFEIIKRFSEMTGPSAQESAVQGAIEVLWNQSNVATERTRTGNLIGRIGGSGPKILLAAHADELCYFVRAIDPRGFLWLANGQGWNRNFHVRDWFTVGQRVRVLARSGELPGVICSVTGHAATLRLPEPRELDWDDLWVDTGMSAFDLLGAGVTPGTRIIWDARCDQIGAHVVGKALDDRVGVALLCEVARRLSKQDLTYSVTLASTIQEEIGTIGAAALAAREQFDCAIVLESGLAGDVPKVSDIGIPVRLGSGPILVHKDSLVHYDHALSTSLERCAAGSGIPLQHAVFGSYGSDGAAFMRADVPTALLAFPTRYTHTPFETAHLHDINALADLICTFLQTPAP